MTGVFAKVGTRWWIVTGVSVAMALLTARLGAWQLSRADEKDAWQAAIVARAAQVPIDASAVARRAQEADAQLHRRVDLSGRWLTADTVYLDNRPHQGRTGFIVVTPLALGDGSAILVQRGWSPRHAQDRTRVAPLETPASDVRVSGRLAPEPSRLYEFANTAQGAIRQNLDIAEFARERALELLPLTVLQISGTDDGLLRDWPDPGATSYKNLGYAFQWFALSALITSLYVWFQLLRPRRARPR